MIARIVWISLIAIGQILQIGIRIQCGSVNNKFHSQRRGIIIFIGNTHFTQFDSVSGTHVGSLGRPSGQKSQQIGKR